MQDQVSVRLRWAVALSLAFNLLIWRSVSAIARHPVFHDLKPVEITRIVAPPPVVRHPPPKPPAPKRIVKLPPPKPPKLKPIPTRVVKAPPPVKIAKLPPPPEGAHHKVLTAIPNPAAPSKPDDHTALAGGNAALGKPSDAEKAGNAVVNPPKPVVTTPAPAPPPPPVKRAPVVVAAPPPPVVKPPPPPPTPAPLPPPRHHGLTRDAEPDNEAKPEIPDDLKNGQFRSFVRVKVQVHEDGSFDVVLRTSSGNEEIDRRVLDALKRWRWKPALKDGEPVESTQLFKFEFEVE